MDLKARIKEHGLTIASVAEKMGVTQSALSQAINSNPTYNKLCEIASILGISVSELVSDGDGKTFVCPHCGKELHVKIE